MEGGRGSGRSDDEGLARATGGRRRSVERSAYDDATLPSRCRGRRRHGRPDGRARPRRAFRACDAGGARRVFRRSRSAQGRPAGAPRACAPHPRSIDPGAAVSRAGGRASRRRSGVGQYRPGAWLAPRRPLADEARQHAFAADHEPPAFGVEGCSAGARASQRHRARRQAGRRPSDRQRARRDRSPRRCRGRGGGGDRRRSGRRLHGAGQRHAALGRGAGLRRADDRDAAGARGLCDLPVSAAGRSASEPCAARDRERNARRHTGSHRRRPLAADHLQLWRRAAAAGCRGTARVCRLFEYLCDRRRRWRLRALVGGCAIPVCRQPAAALRPAGRLSPKA